MGANEWRAQETRMAQRYGFVPSRAPIACPRMVVGKRHLDYDKCPCLKFDRLLDHGRIWRDASRQVVVTGEPYDIDDELLETFAIEMQAIGAEVLYGSPDQSAWYPGHTHLLIIRKAGGRGIEAAQPPQELRRFGSVHAGLRG